MPGGVVSGRWATRGGGALQIPKVVRRAVVADPGWTFVVADAGQLEPRVLAAVSGDARLAAAGGAGDLYAALAAEAFGGDRAKAKVALLGAMYGQTGGAAVPALAALRRVYPTAWAYVEAAARTGEAGGLVRSWLGRTCPPGSAGFGDVDDGSTSRTGGRSARPGRVRRGPGGGSPATSSSRPRPPSGRYAAGRLRRPLAGTRRRAGVLPARRGGRALPRPTQADAVAEAVQPAGERAGGCCSATRRCASRSTSRSSTATPTRPGR